MDALACKLHVITVVQRRTRRTRRSLLGAITFWDKDNAVLTARYSFTPEYSEFLTFLHPAVTNKRSDNELPVLTRRRLPVSWRTDPYSPCSVACGGGSQNRKVVCVRHDIWDAGRTSRVSDILCPSPKPSAVRKCNLHVCMARWRKEEWSECSVTCSFGVQVRSIQCERQMLGGQLFAVSQSECGGLHVPDTTRPCFYTDCPNNEASMLPEILSEKYTLIQLRRAKRLKLIIGGKAKILAGQTIVVKCPVEHYSRRLIYWSKGRKLLPYSGRIRVSSGRLRIAKANPSKDAGDYTCIAGDTTSTIQVEFTKKDDPSTKMYKVWTRRRRRHSNATDFQNATADLEEGRKGILLTSSKFGSRKLDSQQQRDQSRRLAKSLNFVTGDWSTCSATCGSGGHQKRKVTCSHVTRKYIKIVPDVECLEQGLVKPELVQVCLQNTECPVWRPGPWSECYPSCGRVGYKDRFLTCEWDRSGKLAGNTCDIKKKPTGRKPCKPIPCPKVCVDHSRYCSLSRLLKLCRYHGFQQRCCKTCRYLANNIS